MANWLRLILIFSVIIPLAGAGIYFALRTWRRTTWDAVKSDESEARVQKPRRKRP